MYKNRHPRKNIYPEKKMKWVRPRFVYPFVLILFIMFTIYQFFVGENGFYTHREKLKEISKLKDDNTLLGLKIAEINDKIIALEKRDKVAIEREMRLLPLKYSGDKIIKLYHQKWIEEIALTHKSKTKHSKRKNHKAESVFDELRILIGTLISLLFALVLTQILVRKKRKDASSAKIVD